MQILQITTTVCNNSCSEPHCCNTVGETAPYFPHFSLTGLRFGGGAQVPISKHILRAFLHPFMADCGCGNEAPRWSYTQLYESDENTVHAYSCFCPYTQFSSWIYSFMHLAPGLGLWWYTGFTVDHGIKKQRLTNHKRFIFRTEKKKATEQKISPACTSLFLFDCLSDLNLNYNKAIVQPQNPSSFNYELCNTMKPCCCLWKSHTAATLIWTLQTDRWSKP